MIEVAIADLPEGFYANMREDGCADVIYDVTPNSFGTWTSVRVKDGALQLFPKRTYRHEDLLVRLGYLG